MLEPAGMQRAHFGWNPEIRGPVAVGHDPTGEPLDVRPLQQRKPNAAASLLTTIEDYGRFAAWVTRGAGLSAPMFKEMVQPQALHEDPAEQFGLGWRIIQVNGTTVLAHDGREPGVRTQVFAIPETGDALVILTNSDNGELLTRAVARQALPLGEALMEQIARDTWTYLQRMPAEQIPQISRMIVASPPFMARFLYAVDAGLVRGSGMDEAQRQAARDAIAPFVLDLLDGRAVGSRARALVTMALEEGNGNPRWRQTFDRQQARNWLALLSGTSRPTGGEADQG